MLLSSLEYIIMLRKGKYLLFLEWTDFITRKYSNDLEFLDADDIANILIFEWLNNGYVEEDTKKLTILYAVSDLESKPLQGKLDYSLKAISMASFFCAIFKRYNLHTLFNSQNQITRDEINQLMKHNTSRLNPVVFESSLREIQIQFFNWMNEIDKKELELVFQKINAITKPRYILEDYILQMGQVQSNQDPLFMTRLSLVKRFLSYLYEQTELTVEVSKEIAIYVSAIREKCPVQWEVEYLDNISPPSTLENTLRFVTGLGVGFFRIVLQKKSISELISGVSPPKN